MSKTVSVRVSKKGRDALVVVREVAKKRARIRTLICSPIPTKIDIPIRVISDFFQTGAVEGAETKDKRSKATTMRRIKGAKKAKSNKKGKGVTS